MTTNPLTTRAGCMWANGEWGLMGFWKESGDGHWLTHLNNGDGKGDGMIAFDMSGDSWVLWTPDYMQRLTEGDPYERYQ